MTSGNLLRASTAALCATGNLEAFLTVNNLLDERAPLYPSNSGIPGLFYPTFGYYDDMGRYFTTGVRVKF